jgi:hypothetical protein
MGIWILDWSSRCNALLFLAEGWEGGDEGRGPIEMVMTQRATVRSAPRAKLNAGRDQSSDRHGYRYGLASGKGSAVPEMLAAKGGEELVWCGRLGPVPASEDAGASSHCHCVHAALFTIN